MRDSGKKKHPNEHVNQPDSGCIQALLAIASHKLASTGQIFFIPNICSAPVMHFNTINENNSRGYFFIKPTCYFSIPFNPSEIIL